MSEVNELVRFQRELKEEEELILTMLSKIDVQLHALQVEQLQLLSAKNSGKEGSFPVAQNSETNRTSQAMDKDVKKEKELDLAVPHAWQMREDEDEEEEEEEEEDEEDEEEESSLTNH